MKAINLVNSILQNDLRQKTGVKTRFCLLQKGRNIRGFSLVEVVLAIGLTTFALLVMFSLMPVGLNTMQDTNRQIVESEIFNMMGAELTTVKYSLLDDYTASASNFPAYFDMDGLKLAATDKARAVFTVKCAVLDNKADENRRALVFVGYRIKEADLDKLISDKKYSDPSLKCRSFLLSNRGL